MIHPRVIPCLLLKNDGLVKTVKFKNSAYVGDPINAVKIFNEKEVDELILLDIEASKNHKQPNYDFIHKIATECFMPFCYGGGITTFDQVQKIFRLGAEKVSINSAFIENGNIIKETSRSFGSQSIVVSIDVKKSITGKYRVYDHKRKKLLKTDPIEFSRKAESSGAGEILINSVDQDGMMAGLDIKLIKAVSKAVYIPVIACGGARSLPDIRQGIKEGGASAVAAGSMFVFQGKHKAVLINYPEYNEIIKMLE